MRLAHERGGSRLVGCLVLVAGAWLGGCGGKTGKDEGREISSPSTGGSAGTSARLPTTGGAVSASAGSGGQAGAADGDPTPCPPAGQQSGGPCEPGASCSNDGITCVCGGMPMPDASERWECSVLAPECPAGPPDEQLSCSEEGTRCDYLTVMRSCACFDGTWSCNDIDF